MARVNVGSTAFAGTTHEGAPAKAITPEQELRRSVMACLLWEDTFYESGKSIADRIAALVPKVPAEKVSAIAIEARSAMHLRHAPLLLVREMARHASHRKVVRSTLAAVIQRADELSEFLAMYWQPTKQPLAKSVQRGLADAFGKFNAYSLAKYNRENPVKLRDVLFLTHAKPKDAEQAAVWKQLVEGTLAPPDTWEVALSGGKGAEKRETWERLLREEKLGPLALIRNLRNMTESGAADALIRAALRGMKPDRVLPFRFLAAVRHAPKYAAELEAGMLRNLEGASKLPGHTIVLVDISGSMNSQLSAKSDMQRMDAAAGLAVLAREICESCQIASFSDRTVEIPVYRGLGLVQAILQSQPHGGTDTGRAVDWANKQTHDRIVVITDEQSHTKIAGPKGKGYVVNVGSYQPGIGYGPWTHIDGWSDRVLDYVRANETAA